MKLGFFEILLIVIFILLVFGAKRIPELAKALGRASYEFKKAKEDLRAESESLLEEAEKNAAVKDENVQKEQNTPQA